LAFTVPLSVALVPVTLLAAVVVTEGAEIPVTLTVPELPANWTGLVSPA